MKVLMGRVIKGGQARGLALVSPEPIGFFGMLDAETGVIVEKGHPLEGESVAGRVLVFPTGKGSTVGSYSLYRLAKAGLAPAAKAWLRNASSSRASESATACPRVRTISM